MGPLNIGSTSPHLLFTKNNNNNNNNNIKMMKVFFLALACIAAVSAIPLEESNDFAKECLDIQKACMEAAGSKLERVQCWMQFGLCVATHGMKCYTKCIPPMKDCIDAAQHDFLKVLRCGADYIKCVTSCE